MALTWAEQRARQIAADAAQDYGRGWARLGDAQKQEYIQSRVLMLILTQAGDEFKAAQEMARSVLNAAEFILT